MARCGVDRIDRAILDHLPRDGRLANNELAERVGLSPSPCLRRVRRLEADGVIRGYAAIVDRDAVGAAYEPLVWVTLEQVTRDTMSAFERAVCELPSVVEVLRMMGQPDYLLRVVTEDPASFEQLYIDHLAVLPHVKVLTSQLAMKAVKRSTTIPVALP